MANTKHAHAHPKTWSGTSQAGDVAFEGASQPQPVQALGFWGDLGFITVGPVSETEVSQGVVGDV